MAGGATRTFGERIGRNEDSRLVRGAGMYVDDVKLASCLHVAFLRSSYGRARITRIDTSAAESADGVVAIFTADALGELDRELPLLIPHPSLTHARTQRPLARGDVFYVGQPIAMVVAEDRYLAEDALPLIEVDYEILPVVVDVEKAVEEGASLVHPDVPGNVAAHFVQISGDPDRAFDEADHVITVKVTLDRSAAMPMETRAVAAVWDQLKRELTVWDTTQGPISIRGGLASILDIPENKVRVIAPDVGGGFGCKVLLFYPDEVLVPFAARQLGRPVKYVEDRSDHFVGTTHERRQVHEISLAATNDGVVTGLRDSFLHDTGAFIQYGLAVAQVASTQIAGPYRIPNIWVELRAVYTNTMMVTPYRGCGRPHACFAIERAMDALAVSLGIDRMEIRRRNFIQPDEFPYDRPGLIFADGLPVTHDSGRYQECLDIALDAIGYRDFPALQEAARSQGRYLGLGLACYVEGTGLGPYEGGYVKIHPITGKVLAATGLSSQGQGHETTFAQIVADALGTHPTDVVVVEGDTGVFDWGVATFASRAAVVSGNALHLSARRLRTRMLAMAGNMLEADPEDLQVEGGEIWVKGTPQRKLTFADVATAANPLRYAFSKAAQAATQFAPAAKHDGPPLEPGTSPGLEETQFYSPPHATWANGVHAAIVEVDIETGQLTFNRYVCVHDCGNMINPMIVEGQVLGGIAQGLAGAFYERMEYGEDGQLTNASFMDFLMPYATEIPQVELHHLETPSPLNPLGVKGVGEAGTIPVSATLVSAVEDALRPFDIRFLHAPLSPGAIRDSIRRATVRP